MLKVLHVKEVLGGSLAYQADIQDRLVKKLEDNLNSLKLVKIHSVSTYKEDAEFGLVAIVEVTAEAKSKAKAKK